MAKDIIDQIPYWNLRNRLRIIDNSNVQLVFEKNLKKFYLINSDDVEIDGEKKSRVEREILLLRNQPFEFIACKTKDGFELTELDFIETEIGIIEKGKPFVNDDWKLRKQLAIYEAYLNQRKAALSQKPQQINIVSFLWQNNAEQELPELYSLMLKKYNLIASDTTLEQFKAIFTGQPIETIEPVKWHQDNASELLYFYIQLLESKNIDGNANKLDYKKLLACFVKPDGQPYEANFKQLKTNIEINLSKNKMTNISSLLKNF